MVDPGTLAVTWAEVGIAVISGGLAGAALSALVGPLVVTRQERIETFRNWQADLAGAFLTELIAVRDALGEVRDHPNDDARRANASALIDRLEVLAQRIELVFQRRKGAPGAARAVVEAARNALRDANPAAVDEARETFVDKASDEIRGR